MRDLNLRLQQRIAEMAALFDLLPGGIAHDFNNLLTGILDNASLARLSMQPQQTDLANSLHNIEQSSLRAADLCKQLLAYAGKGRLVIEPLDLSSLVQEAVHMLEVSISKKTSIQLHLSPALPAFQGDATQIRQVLMNLVINASEAIGDRQGIVTIHTGRVQVTADYLQRFAIHDHLGDSEYVSIEVPDNGSGMSNETKSRIFDPFYTTKFTGRGLGLAAVLGIVRRHKGTVKVYSEPGRGTTFKLLFPATNRPPPLPNTSRSPPSRPGGAPATC